MKKQLLFLFVCFTYSLKAQLSIYYQKGETNTKSALSTEKGSGFITQFSYFNFAFVEQRLNNSLEKEVDFLAFTSGNFKKIDSFEVFERKYKRIENPEIIPSKETLSVRYFTRVIENERYISKVEFTGNEGMIFAAYKDFWKPSIDLQETKNGKVEGHRFWNDTIELLAKTPIENSTTSYTLCVSSNQIQNFQEFEKNYINFKKAENELNIQREKRKNIVYTYKELSPSEFEIINQRVSLMVEKVLSTERRTSYNEKYEIQLVIDSLGKSTFNVITDGFLSVELRNELNKIYVEPLKENGQVILTKDDFKFSMETKTMTGTVRQNKKGLQPYLDESERFMEIVNRNSIFFNRGLGRYDISIQTINVNNVELNDLSINKFHSRVKAGNTFRATVFIAIITSLAIYFNLGE